MRKRKICIICLPVILWFIIMGLYRCPQSTEIAKPWPEGKQITVSGTIYRISESRSGKAVYLKHIRIVDKDRDRDPGTDQNTDLNTDHTSIQDFYRNTFVLIYLKEEKDLHIGDYITVAGNCTYPSEAMNPGGFNGASYYAARNIYLILKKSVIRESVISPSLTGEAFRIVRERIASAIDSSAEETEAAILKSLLLGDKSTLDSEIKELYQTNGIIHVLAISGLHISMIGMSIYQLLRKRYCSFLTASILSFTVVTGYGILTEFQTSSIRAIIMFSIYLGSQILGKTYDMPISMLLAAMIMLCKNPLLFGQSGFLLSFGAIAGVYTSQMVQEKSVVHMEGKEEYNDRISAARKNLKNAFSVSFWVWIVTLPVTEWFFYQVPLSGILLNLFVVPSMTIVLVMGMVGTAAAFVSPLIGTFFLAPVHYVLKITILICEKVRLLPFTLLITGKPTIIRVVIYYVILYGSIFLIHSRTKSQNDTAERLTFRFVTLVYRVLSIMIILLVLNVHLNEPWSITFLNVGQGDGICLQTDEGHTWMIDGGSSSVMNMGSNILEPYLKCKGISKVDGWFVSHYDQDHVNGLLEILNDYQNGLTGSNVSGITIGQIILPETGSDALSSQLEEIIALAEFHHIKVRYVSKGDEISDGNTHIRVLGPLAGKKYEDSNAGSMILKLTFKGFTALLTGDVQGEGEKDLLNMNLGNIDVLKVSHHGSHNSSSMEILKHINPQVAVISCGKDNRYGHPHQEVLERLQKLGCSILRTDENGAVHIEMSKS